MYYKPQSPIQKNEDYIYPLTTIDQIIVNDNERLNAKCVTISAANSEDGSANLINADSLGGQPAEYYATKSETKRISATSFTLNTNSWIFNSSSNAYEQNISIPGLTNLDIVIVAPCAVRTFQKSYAECAIIAEYNKADFLTFSCLRLPNINIEVNAVIIWEAK